jgi:hypothetical protein
VLLPLVVTICACAPDAQGVFGKMHEAACQGDADKFFVYVAQDALVENQVKRLPAAAIAVGQDAAKAMARESMNDWRKDITAKKTDGICAWSYVSSEHIGEQDRVELRSQAGNKKYMYFAKVGDGLKVVDFQAVEAPAPAASTIASSTPDAAPPLIAIDVCHQLEIAGVVVDCTPGDANVELASFKVPGLRFSGGKSGGMVMQAADDKSYGYRLGIVQGKGKTTYRNARARTIVMVLSDAPPPAPMADKIQGVLDAL